MSSEATIEAGVSILPFPYEAIQCLKLFEVSVGGNIERMLRRLVCVLPEAGNLELRPLAIRGEKL